MMGVAEVFRYLLTNKAFPDKAISEYEFVFKTVFYKRGQSYCYCRCAYDHEYFSYVSETGDIDMGTFDRLATAVKDGYCQHTIRLIEKEYLRETRVNIFHIAAALGSEELTEAFTSGLHTGPISVQVMNSELFKLHPHDIAVIKGNVTVSRLFSKVHPPVLDRRWDDSIVHAIEKEQSNELHVEKTSLLELCIKTRDLPMLEMLIKTREPTRSLSGRARIYELLFKNNLTDLLNASLKVIMAEHEQWRSQLGGDPYYDPDDVRRYNMLEDVPSITKLAVIYNQRDIFEKSLQLLSEGWDSLYGNPLLTVRNADGHPLITVCRAFKWKTFHKPLLQKEVQNLSKTHSTTKVSNFVYLYGLLTQYTSSVVYIKHAMEQLPNICEIINNPFDKTSKEYATREGLTPLQSYVSSHTMNESVVRTLIELGADIDQVYPKDLKVYSRSLNDMISLPGGQSLILYVCLLNENDGFKREWRKVLELLLYENVSLGRNKSVVAFGLNLYKNQVLSDMQVGSRSRIYQSEETESGTYLMDATIHESALDFTVPLLIEAGFHYTCADIDEVLRLSNDSEEEREGSQRRLIGTRNAFQLDNYVLAYLEKCVSEPRPLKLRCRDALRNHFPRRQIHRFVSSVALPQTIIDFLLLTPILQTLPDDN